MKNPCLTCTRVKDPSECSNKSCPTWQEWFVQKWNEMQGRVWPKGD